MLTTSGFFETVERLFHDWNYRHPAILYALMRSLKPKVAVEIGSYRGYAACYMSRALQENGSGHLYAIDDFSEGMQKKYDVSHWQANLEACGVRDFATICVGKSSLSELWPETVDFAYVDGWHSFKQTRYDFIMAANRGAECICLDDITSTVGPSMFIQFIREEYRKEWDVCEIYRDCGLAICVRKKPKPPVTFSQELPNHPGVVLTGMTAAEKRKHLDDASKVTGIDYSDYQLS